MMSKPYLPTSRQAVIEDVDGKPKIAEIPMPELIPGTVLIKTEVVALNPSDYKMGASFPSPGAVIGNDFAGTVIAVAEGTETEIKPGDIVFGGSHGSNPGNPESGAFATYVRAPADVVLRLYPESRLTMKSAATFGVALATCSLSLWGQDALGLQATPYEPSAERFPVLVYGGSTATGTVAIQLLKLSGLDPIATCSPRNFDLVRAAGATAVFDYADPHSMDRIKEYTKGQLKNVLDCISDPQSVEFCYNAIARVGGRYVSLEYVPDELLARRRAVNASFVMAYEIVGEEVKLPGAYGKPADDVKRELGASCFAMFEGLLREGKLRPHPIEQLERGLHGVLDGLALLKSGSVSGRKLVAVLSP
ncbi:putative secondary metabolism biosynthetic enzyme [Diaporthe australafricana]|uniref:Secondary metabolism biosynthetic enzyme n=1 Tax=Diaporthe australafricana TaxID=127596 RepID=A0ABR3Y514_9PEZI